MAQKQLKDIKHGQRVVDSLDLESLYFVVDIQRKTGLDSKSLKRTLTALLKHGYLDKGPNGQWYVSS
jgi:DNA-binding IclR family transcriptional regulator